jgi:hypothetical protein
MKARYRWILGATVVIALYAVGNWMWTSPSAVDRRVGALVKVGMPASEVRERVGASNAVDFPAYPYCAPNNSARVTRISRYTSGGVGLGIEVMPTTTIFCFDSADRLVAFKTARWVDGP